MSTAPNENTAVDSGAGAVVRPIASCATGTRAVLLEVGLAIAVLLLLIALRAPGILMQGRFWAEEGYLFAAIQERSSPEQLFHLAYGQLQLLLNISLTLAAHVTIDCAPLATSYFGIVMTCCLAGLLVGFRRDLGIDLPSALLISVLLVTSSAAAETFANSTTLQWIAAALVMVAILLPGEVVRAHLRWMLPLVVLLGLSGIPSSSLAPVAVLFALARRSRVHALMAAVLAVCLAIELSLVMSHGIPGRTQPTDPYVYVTASFLQLVVKPALGVEATAVLGDTLRQATVHTRPLWALLILPAALLVASGLFIGRNWRHPLSLALLSIGYIVTLNVFGSLGDPRDMIGVFAMRYFFLPTVIALATAAMLLRKYRVMKGVSASACVLALAATVSTTDYFVHPSFEVIASDKPSWRAELAKCPPPPERCRVAISPGHFIVEVTVPR